MLISAFLLRFKANYLEKNVWLNIESLCSTLGKLNPIFLKKYESPKGEYNLSLQVALSFHCLEQYLTQPLSLCLVSDLMHRPSFQLAWGEKHYLISCIYTFIININYTKIYKLFRIDPLNLAVHQVHGNWKLRKSWIFQLNRRILPASITGSVNFPALRKG